MNAAIRHYTGFYTPVSDDAINRLDAAGFEVAPMVWAEHENARMEREERLPGGVKRELRNHPLELWRWKRRWKRRGGK